MHFQTQREVWLDYVIRGGGGGARMDFHLVLHGEHLRPINYENVYIYFYRDFLVPGDHPELLQLFDNTCQISFLFLTIVFIESLPVQTRIMKGLYMDFFDTMLAYAYMQTNFLPNFEFKIFKKNISEIHENVDFCLQFPN